MKSERKLSLVKSPPSGGASPPDEHAAAGAPDGDLDATLEATPEELREAEALRRSLERGEDPMAEALRAAFRPAPLDPGDLEAILAGALRASPREGAADELDAPATRLEMAAGDRLRATLEEHDALRSGKLLAGPGAKSAVPEDSSAATAIALRAAWAPTPIGAARNDALVSRALESAAHSANDGAGSASKGARLDPPAPISLRRFRIGTRTIATMTAVVAMAAGVLLFVGRFGTQSASAPAGAVAQAPAPAPNERDVRTSSPRIAARSTQELFDAATPFPRSGGESERVDRIAAARAADLRANRFASWGVR